MFAQIDWVPEEVNFRLNLNNLRTVYDDVYDGKKYELLGFTNHVSHGGRDGHYTAFCRLGETWWEFDDLNETRIANRVINPNINPHFLMFLRTANN